MISKSFAQWLSIFSTGMIFIWAPAIAELPTEAPTSDALSLELATPVPPPVLSGTIYVSDELKTALRTGASTQYRISAFLTSGQPLTVLSSSDNWIEVEVIGANKSGWVNRENIQTHLGAKDILAKKEASITQLKADLQISQEEEKSLQTQLNETQQNLAAITEQFSRLNQEYDELQTISKAAVTNHKKMQSMREQIATLKTKSGELEIAHALLKQDNYNQGMIHALIAVIFGILITLIIPRMKKKRSSNGWD